MWCYVTNCSLVYPDLLNIFNKFAEIIVYPRQQVGSIRLAFAAVIMPYRRNVYADAFVGNVVSGKNPRCAHGRAWRNWV